jgi:hypothetical protein
LLARRAAGRSGHLPTLLGGVKELTGSFGGGFLLFGLAALGSVGLLVYVSRAWEGSFVADGGVATASPDGGT